MPTNLKNLLSRSRSKSELKTPSPPVTPAETGIESTTPTIPEADLRQDTKRKPFSGAKSSHDTVSALDAGPGTTGMRRDLSSKSLHATFGSTVTPTTTTVTPANGSIQASKLSVGPTSATTGAGMRKSETMLALTQLTGKTGSVRDKIFSASTQTLSNLLSASTTKLFSGFKGIGMGHRASSRSQLASIEDNLHDHGQGQVATPVAVAPLTPVNRLRKNWSTTASIGASMTSLNSLLLTTCPCCNGNTGSGVAMELIPCRLCLSSVKPHETVQLQKCSCRYCKDCLEDYCAFEIQEGAYEIACPDAGCPSAGILTLREVEALVTEPMVERFKRFRLARDVEMDAYLCWCPVPGCETICHIEQVCDINTTSSPTQSPNGSPIKTSGPVSVALRVQCPKCDNVSCGRCRRAFHHTQEPSCDAWKCHLIREGKLSPNEDDDMLYGQGHLDSIKQCPHCHVPIEKDSGCAQMMCKRCKHVFCWYCLQSLDDDFLLRHYDRGPCKNKLGHSRASIIWHRAQVIGIFAGFGILVVLASPLLILAAPCLLCCRCRYCSTKDGDGGAEVTLTSSSTASQFQLQHATMI